MNQLDEKTRTFFELLDGFETAMLVSRMRDNTLRSRPMNIASYDEDGTLWFATSIDSAKADDLIVHSEANISLQGSDKYMSISGEATVTQDAEKVEELWDDSWGVWFDGKDDPKLCLVRFDANYGEYWDLGGKGLLEFVFKAGKAFLLGEKLTRPLQAEVHEELRLN